MANVCAVSFLLFSLVPWRWSCRRSCRRFCRQVRRRCVACRRSYRISWCRQPGHVVGIIMVDILIQYVFIGFGFVSDLVAVFFAVGLFVTSVFSSLLCSVLSSVFVCHLVLGLVADIALSPLLSFVFSSVFCVVDRPCGVVGVVSGVLCAIYRPASSSCTPKRCTCGNENCANASRSPRRSWRYSNRGLVSR